MTCPEQRDEDRANPLTMIDVGRKDADLAAYRRWLGIMAAFPDIKGSPGGEELLKEADDRSKALASNAQKIQESQKTCQQREAFGVRAKIPGFTGFATAIVKPCNC